MVLPCLMAIFNSIGGRCLDWIGESFRTEAAYLIAYAENIDTLREEFKNSAAAIKSLQKQIQEAENNQGGTSVNPVVERFLERMASLEKEASEILKVEEQSSDSKCLLMGLHPNPRIRYQTSKSAKHVAKKAVLLSEDVNKYDKQVVNVDSSDILGVSPMEEFENFDSRDQVKNKIVAALKDPSVNKVGVYGMGGTGKTQLAQKIGEIMHVAGTFKYVVLATVSEKQNQNQHDNDIQLDLLNIQNQIADGFNIQLRNKTLTNRAKELHNHLQKRDKVLIILDDIWSEFELKDVGIPFHNVQKNFKILMTSRSKTILSTYMGPKNNFQLDSLPPSDAWNLFDKMVGGKIQNSTSKYRTAQQIVNHCAGIPIVLVTIAKALKDRELNNWEDALNRLKQFNGKEIVEKPYKMIEVSYKFLKSEEKRNLLLLCAQLNHRSIAIEDLLKYAMGLDLFEECDTVKQVCVRLHTYLDDLKGWCLLQDGNKKGIIKMHDLVHKFATSVASSDPHRVFSVANDGELERWPSREQFEKFRAISFFYSPLLSDHELPIPFVNPYLQSFLMLRSENDASIQIPDKFFQGMKGLKVMNLTKIPLSPILVSSLSALVQLRTLCLDYCKLSDITVIGELKTLQALSLVGSSIVWVPKEIGELCGSLKLLDLRGCVELETIVSGVISRLTLLEDLRIGESFSKWQRLDSGGKSINSVNQMYEAKVASLEEFKKLQNLINLEIHVGDHVEMYPKDLVFTKLETFTIFIGSGRGGGYMNLQQLPKAALVVDESSTIVEFDSKGSKALMKNAESILLQGVKSCPSVSEMDPEGFSELKHLKVHDGHGIQYILKKDCTNCIFPMLETLDLVCLFELKRICDGGSLLVGSFKNLRVISVTRCHLSNDLLSSNSVKCISQLKEIRVNDCKSMEGIIISREGENKEIKTEFTHLLLRVLELCELPGLVSFYHFKQLHSPTHLFNKKIMLPKLEVLKLSSMKIEKIWDDHLVITAEGTCWLQNLTSLNVNGCHNLSYVFTLSMVKSLTQLQELTIKDCGSIEEIVAPKEGEMNCDSNEEIVATKEGEMEGGEWLLFPKLESLVLEDLPKLKIFCHADLLECQSLHTVKIMHCPLLKAFTFTEASISVGYLEF